MSTSDKKATKSMNSITALKEKVETVHLQVIQHQQAMQWLAEALNDILSAWFSEYVSFFGDDPQNEVMFEKMPCVIAARVALENSKPFLPKEEEKKP